MELEPILGQVIMFAGSVAPKNWEFCNGQLVSTNEYSTLFILLGTTYGGDGVSTFGLPDLRGRVPLHYGTGPGLEGIALGQMGGVEQVTLSTKHIPPHAHPLDGVSEAATTNIPSAEVSVATASLNAYVENKLYPIEPTPAEEPKSKLPTLVAMNAMSVSASATGGKPVSLVQPYQGINFIIAMEGVYPSRD